MSASSATRLAPAEEPDYRDFLESCPAAQLFQSPEYLDLVAGHLGCERATLVMRGADGRLDGALPLMTGRFAEVGTVVNSLPFYGSHGGPLLSPTLAPGERSEVLAALSEGLDVYLEEVDAVAWTLVTSPLASEIETIRAAFRHDYTDTRIGQIAPLPAAEGDDPGPALMAGFDKPRPRNIRKAIRSGITVRPANGSADLEFLAETHRTNMLAVGAKPKDPEFFELAAQTMPEDALRITIAELEGERVAALLVFHAFGTAEYFTPAVVEAHRSLQPMSLLVFLAMKDAVRGGMQRFSFGGTAPSQKGVYDFKKKWGAVDRPYEYLTRVRDRSVLLRRPEELLASCPHFFVVPFHALEAGENDG